MQILDQERYAVLSDKNRIRVTLNPAIRGKIEDRWGRVVAHSVPYYNAVVNCKSLDCLLKCREVISLGKTIKFELDKFNMEKPKRFVLKDHLTWEEVSWLEARKNELPMIEVQRLYERSYPLDSMTPHFIGYTSRISESHPYAKKLPFANVGRSGLEKDLDERLFGIPDMLEEEVNAHGKVVRSLSHTPGVLGKNIRLTIDQDIQKFAYEKLTPYKSGAVIVMDAVSGELLTLASYPSFNPGIFESGISHVDWNALRNSQQTPLVDKNIMGMYPPGSLIKPLVLLAALEEGMITPETRFNCQGSVTIDGQVCHCWKSEGHGIVNLEEALRGSCNVYIYEVARMMAQDRLQYRLSQFGVGALTGSGLSGEKQGLLPSDEWKRKYRKDRWRRIDTVYVNIGQGYLLMTPLQMAKMMAQFVNGGTLVRPHVVQETSDKKRESINVSKQRLKLLTYIMGEVINHPKGTGYRSRVEGESWQMGGKSGTSQVRRITQKERDEGTHHGFDWEWKEKDHSLFAGFAPVGNPRYVVVVLVEHGGFGSAVAAPMGRDIMKRVMRKYGNN